MSDLYVYLIRFRNKDNKNVPRFIERIKSKEEIKSVKTPHGYAIAIPHGFDTRKLMDKWKEQDISLHKERLLFLDMITKKES